MSFPQLKPKKEKVPMKLIKVTLVAITELGLCAAPLAFAENDSFVGKWKFNPEKSQLNGLTYKVDQGGTGKYKFTFADDTETLTLGKEHVTKYGNTWLITQSARTLTKVGAKARRESLFRRNVDRLGRQGHLHLRQHGDAPGWF